MEFITYKSLCSICLSRWQRFEPVTAGWEARTLPLCYTAQLQTSNTYHFTSSNVIFLLFRDSSGFSSNVKKNLLLLIFYCFFLLKNKKETLFFVETKFQISSVFCCCSKKHLKLIKMSFFNSRLIPTSIFCGWVWPFATFPRSIYTPRNLHVHKHTDAYTPILARTHSLLLDFLHSRHTHTPSRIKYSHRLSLSLSWAA